MFLFPPRVSESRRLTRQQGEEALAASAVPDQQGVGGATAVAIAATTVLAATAPAAAIELHVDALRAQPHLQVAQLADGMAVALLQPLGQLVPARDRGTGGINKFMSTIGATINNN